MPNVGKDATSNRCKTKTVPMCLIDTNVVNEARLEAVAVKAKHCLLHGETLADVC